MPQFLQIGLWTGLSLVLQQESVLQHSCSLPNSARARKPSPTTPSTVPGHLTSQHRRSCGPLAELSSQAESHCREAQSPPSLRPQYDSRQLGLCAVLGSGAAQGSCKFASPWTFSLNGLPGTEPASTPAILLSHPSLFRPCLSGCRSGSGWRLHRPSRSQSQVVPAGSSKHSEDERLTLPHSRSPILWLRCLEWRDHLIPATHNHK